MSDERAWKNYRLGVCGEDEVLHALVKNKVKN